MPISGSYYYFGVQSANLAPLAPPITYTSSVTLSGNADYSIALSSTDVSRWSNVAISVENNGAMKIESGSIEWSPDGAVWETDWDLSTFDDIAVGALTSAQVSGNSRKYLRVRLIPSGSGGTFTGSANINVTCNNG